MLECRNVAKQYDGIYALKGVNFEVLPGEIHALCGENGAGKSTLAKIIAGVVTPDEGEMTFNGKPMRISRPIQARRMGIGIVFQELDLFEDLSVGENMILGNRRAERPWANHGSIDAFCKPFLKQVGLDISSRVRLGDLSIAAMQLVAIARALSMNAKILLLDEPTSSLTEEAADRFLRLVVELKRMGTGVVYVSHKMKEIFQLADRITVLRDGEHVSTKHMADTSIEETIRLMVGRTVDLSHRIQEKPQEEITFAVRHLKTHRLKDISFTARKGEVLGIAGLVGSGRSALGEALFGLDKWLGGEVECEGNRFHPRHPREAINFRFAYLPEDRRTQGLFLSTCVRHNASCAILPSLSRLGFVLGSQEKAVSCKELARTRTKAASDALPVRSLSGGNQQKVLLAKWLLPEPHVLYLDDPTRGVDVGAKSDVYQIIEALASTGKTILMVSSELPELLRCTHRILVLHEGRSVGILDTASATQEKILRLAAGEPIESTS